MKKVTKILLILLIAIIIFIVLALVEMNINNKKEINTNENKIIINTNEIEKDSKENNLTNETNINSTSNEQKKENITTYNSTEIAENSRKTKKNQSIKAESKTENKAESKKDTIFLTDFENYNPVSNVEITKEKASQIAENGFTLLKDWEGVKDEYESFTKEEDVIANNFFVLIMNGTISSNPTTQYKNIKRSCYTFLKENEMGNGVYVSVDKQTGLIIAGGAFGD